jgi:hypothetical protein
MTESEKYRAKTVRMAVDQARFREGMKSDDEKASEKRMMDAYIKSKVLGPRQLTPPPRTEPLSFGAAGRDFGINPEGPAAGPQQLTPRAELLSFGAAGRDFGIKPEGPAVGGGRGFGPYSPDFKLAEEAPGETPAVQEEPKKEEEETVQRKTAGGHSIASAPSIVNEVLQGSGEPLDAETRRFMEGRFGHDFSNVRVHRGNCAEASARAVDAHAYTVGKDIVFGAGAFSPNTVAGRYLLAHELTHVLQQDAAKSCAPKMVFQPRIST